MASFIHGLNLLLFFFFCIYPLVFCQLSSNQTTVMVGVSQLLRNETSSWSDTNQTNPCRWKGVICNSPLNNSITSVSLRGFGLFNSSFLTLLCQIDSLQYLDFSNNMFVSIPDGFFTACGGIDGLKVLNFSRNMLNGPLPTFHNFVGLESLDLSFNALNGEIESQLDDLSSLKSLNLSFNNFSGSVPIPLGKSRVLERLELSENRFIGEISGDIEMYGNLIYIDLSGNKLSGKVPVSIGNLTKLEFLILSSNRLSGEIPETILNISTLQRFSANQNSFSGSISGSIHGDISRSLKILDLSFNHLTGKIPSQFLSSSNLQTVDLSYNKLDGPIPEKISQGLIRLRLGSNLLSGSIPSVAFDSLNNLMYLELDNNSLTGSIPPKIGSCKNLALLNLAGNKLSGTLPGELLNLTRLQVLKLQLNKFDGEIPSGIGQLNMLTTFNISGNSLSGIIPPSIVNCGKLSNLILQGNILSGSIPGDINRLSNLVELQLGENKLNGRIPEMPSKLQICLDLSGNLFEGTIPKTLSGLPSLEILDLSNNRFSGEVPEFLTQLSSLTQLILSNNQLSGVLPKFNPHVSVNYNGTQVTPAEENHQPSSKNGKSITITVVITVSAAVIAVGVVAVVSLLISRRFYKVNDEQPQSWEVLSPPRVLQGNLLTSNGIHRSNIDFAKAMQVVANPANIALKTRFSIYYKAIMPSGASYYVKKLNWSDKIFQLGSHDKFERELVALGKLSNSNVMIPLAYVLTVDSAYLFYEFAPKGTLYDVLHGSQKTSLDWASRYSIAVGVAQGLAFLHGCASSPILLLDLSTKNIVLKSLKEPQVGDIELCKVIDPSKSTGSLSTVAGSVGYIPPEYAYTMRVTMAGNVYSFGVVLLELLTGKPAVTQGTELAKWVLSNSAHTDKRDHILDFSISRTSQVIRNQMLAVLKVALACVNVSPEARPKMKSVIRMLLMQDKSSVTI